MKGTLISVFTLILISCSSQRKLEMGAIPFDVTKATIQEWSGGRAESGSGADLKLYVVNATADVTFDKIYFRERILDFSTEMDNGILIMTASYKTNDTVKTEAKEDIEAMKSAFKLTPNEAIVSFKIGSSRLKYTQVENIKQMQSVMFKSKPKN